MKSRLISTFSHFFAFCIILLLAGCGGGGGSGVTATGISPSAATGSIAVNLTSSDVASSSAPKTASTQYTVVKSSALMPGVVTVRFAVSGPGMTTMVMDFPASAGSGVINGIPVGSGRILTIQGLDVNGLVISSAEVPNITVLAGQTSNLGTVVMNSITPTNVFTTAMLSGKTFTYADSNSNTGTVTFNADGTSTGIAGTWTINASGQLVMHVTSSANIATFTLSSVNGTTITASESVSNGNVATITFTEISTTGYNISGMVLVNGAGLSGATVTAGSYSTTTLADGSYTISGVPNGSYTLAASKSGYSFTPTSLSVTVNNTNLTGQNFTGTSTPTGYSISGFVTYNGSGLAGATVAAGAYSTITQADGSYTISGVANGAYTLTPFKTGYTFSPASSTLTVNSANVTGQNFAGTPVSTSYSISGTVTYNGTGLSGVTVSVPAGYMATTGANGAYTITGVPNGSYTLRAVKTGYTFSPSSYSVTVSGASVTGKDFSNVASSYSISGTILYTGLGLSGVTVSAGGSYTASTDTSGYYIITGVPDGSYTVTPSKLGHSFSPTSQAVTVSGSNQTGKNFTAM